MSKQTARGFTLIEVVLAIAVGLIIIAGVSVGYAYAKHAAQMDNSRKDVAFIKTYVETAITAQQAGLAAGGGPLLPPAITYPQLTALAQQLPSMRIDPYTGRERVVFASPGPSYYTAGRFNQDGVEGQTVWNSPHSRYVPAWVPGTGSVIIYLYGDTFNRKFTITLADGTTQSFYGYIVWETDADSNYVAAAGGSQTN